MMVYIGRGDYVRADLIQSVEVFCEAKDNVVVVRWIDDGGVARSLHHSGFGYADALVLTERIASDIKLAMQSVGNYRRPW